MPVLCSPAVLSGLKPACRVHRAEVVYLDRMPVSGAEAQLILYASPSGGMDFPCSSAAKRIGT